LKKKILLIFLLVPILGFSLLFHKEILEAYARLFVVSNATKNADMIIVLSGAPEERLLEAIKLYKKGYSKKIFYTDPIKYESEHKYPEIFLSQLTIAKKVAQKEHIKIHIIPNLNKGATSTFDEAYDTARYVKKHNIKHIILITSAFHSRRALYAFKKIFQKKGIDINIEMYVPPQQLKRINGWWRREVDISYMVTEPFKMLIYFFRTSNLESIKAR